MSYVQTVIDPLYTVRYSALGRLRYRDEPRKRKPIWVGPERGRGFVIPEIKPTRYGPPRPVRPPIRTLRLRKRPAPGLGSFPTEMMRRVMEKLKEEARRTGVILPSEIETIFDIKPKPGLVETILDEVRRKADLPPGIVIGSRGPREMLERVVEEVRRKAGLPDVPFVISEPTTIMERVLDEVRRKAIPIEIPAFEVDDAVIVGPPRKPFIKSKTRTEVVSVPVDKADPTLAFQLAEAEKYGYTHAAWMALGIGGRGEVRRAYADRYKPTTPGGTPIDAATVEFIAGPDPLREMIHDTGAGDYPGGLEFKTPDPNVRLKRTTAGLTFDDVLRIDPILIQTAEEAAGLVPVGIQKYATYGLLAVSAWILYDSLVKTKRPRRRRAPARGRSRRTRRR